MAGKGPPRTPTAKLALTGSWRAKQRERREPKPRAVLPSAPSWLDRKAKIKFRALAEELHGCGLLSAIDAGGLARYCRLWSRWRSAEEKLKASDTVEVVTREGHKRVEAHPMVRVASDLAGHLLRLEQQFGMTPAARASLSVDANPPKDHADEDPFAIRTG